MHRDCQSPSCKFDWLWRNVRLEKRRKSACIHLICNFPQKSDTRIDDTVAASHWSVTLLETVGLPLPSTTLVPLLALQRVEALARVIVGMFPPSKRSKNWYITIMSLWWYTIQVAYDTSYIMYIPYTYTIFSYLSTSTNNYGYIFIMIIHKWGLFSVFFSLWRQRVTKAIEAYLAHRPELRTAWPGRWQHRVMSPMLPGGDFLALYFWDFLRY